jgi:hypothetical protein
MKQLLYIYVFFTVIIKGKFVIFYMLAKYVPGDIKYIFTKIYRHISTNNEVNRKFVILISNKYVAVHFSI